MTAPPNPGHYLNAEQLADFCNKYDATSKCRLCRFWEPHEPPNWTWPEYLKKTGHDGYIQFRGECRKRSPTISGNGDTEWPNTYWNDWCGDHQQVIDHCLTTKPSSPLANTQTT